MGEDTSAGEEAKRLVGMRGWRSAVDTRPVQNYVSDAKCHLCALAVHEREENW
jgi:hypothetical protein